MCLCGSSYLLCRAGYNPGFMLLLATFGGFMKAVLMLVFVLSALLLMLVVLLQEPKGGGLSSAFGGAGAETFGVQTGSVNKFTAWVAAVFMASALVYAAWRPDHGPSVMDAPPGNVQQQNNGGAQGGGGAPPGNGENKPEDDGQGGN